MDIGRRLRELRVAKGLSHADIEKRTGLMRAYISRIECGHSIPSLATLEKWVKGLDLQMYQAFFEGRGKPVTPRAAKAAPLDARERKLIEVYRELPEQDRVLFLAVMRDAVKRARRKGKAKKEGQ